MYKLKKSFGYGNHWNETATYEKTLKEIENFLDTIDKLITASSHKTIGEWLDNQEVCLILKIAPRTLQNLRDTDQISYSQIGKKIYYKKEDIQKFIEKHNSHEQSNHTR